MVLLDFLNSVRATSLGTKSVSLIARNTFSLFSSRHVCRSVHHTGHGCRRYARKLTPRHECWPYHTSPWNNSYTSIIASEYRHNKDNFLYIFTQKTILCEDSDRPLFSALLFCAKHLVYRICCSVFVNFLTYFCLKYPCLKLPITALPIWRKRRNVNRPVDFLSGQSNDEVT